MSLNQKIAVVFIFFLGLFLRFHAYDVYPQRGATSDEYTYAFLGQSLLTKGIPISWSHFGFYKNKFDLTIDHLYFPIVWPYFDHPPLNGIVVASWALLNGEDSFEDITLQTIRIVPILLTTLSSLFLFLWLNMLYGYGVALLGLLIYSTATIMVVSSRVVMAEHLLTTIFLTALLYYERVKKKLGTREAVVLGVLSGLAIWTKELGVVVGLTIGALALYDRQKASKIVPIGLGIFLTVLLYVAYGFYYDGEVFLAIVGIQASRQIGPETLWNLIARPVLINKLFYGGGR